MFSCHMEYEDYTSTSKRYDNLRRPIGLDSLDSALEMASNGLGKPINELRLLDVGCGTGNYLNVLKGKVGACYGLDFNEGMLALSKAKHEGDGRVTLRQGSVLKMDFFEDAEFDFVIMTQVLHHLTPDMHAQALGEISRVLQKKGVFWISTQTPHQHMDGFWWAPIIPQAAAVLAARFPGTPLFRKKLLDAGLKSEQVTIPSESLIQLDAYRDPMAPFYEEYRNCDSTWSLASSDELSAGLAWWQQMHDEGRAQDFVNNREKVRDKIGQTTTVMSIKL